MPHWIRTITRYLTPRPAARRRPTPRVPLRLEVLEDRLAPASLASINVAGTDSGNAASGDTNLFELPQVSHDGRYVAFFSLATNLVNLPDGNTAGSRDIFLRDRVNGTTTLVNVNGAGTAGCNGAVGNFALSADGRYAAFDSSATDIIPGLPANGGNGRIFLRDLQTGTYTLVTNASTGGGEGTFIAMSPDGRYVAYRSRRQQTTVQHFTPPPDFSEFQLYVFDRITGTTTMASVNSTGTRGGNQGTTAAPVFSPDGTHLVFSSTSTDLVANDTNGTTRDVFVRNLVTGTTTLVTVNAAGTGSANNESGAGSALKMSADNRRVLFHSSATDIVTGVAQDSAFGNVYIRDLQSGTTTMVSVNAAGTASGGSNADFSSDGRFVVFTSVRALLPGLSNAGHIFRRDMQTGQILLVDVRTDGTSASGTLTTNLVFKPVPRAISADGRFVTFISGDANLVPGFVDGNPGANDVYVRDMLAGVTTLLSRTPGSATTGSNGDSRFPVISANGRVVAFYSLGSDLVATDTNTRQDVFAADVPPTRLQRIVASADEGGPPTVRVFTPQGNLVGEFNAYGTAFTGGVRVATADITGDQVPEIFTAPGPGGAPFVNIFDGATFDFLRSVQVYGDAFTLGVNLAVADVQGIGTPQIITAPDTGGEPFVNVLHTQTGQLLRSFLAYGQTFTLGVRVATGDVTGDGRPDILTAPDTGGSPFVNQFDGQGNRLRSVQVYGDTFTGGVFLAAGDVTGDGTAELLVGPGEGGLPRVNAFSATGSFVRQYAAYGDTFTRGVRVGAADLNGDGRADVIAGPGRTGSPQVKVLDGLAASQFGLFAAFDETVTSGLFVLGYAV